MRRRMLGVLLACTVVAACSSSSKPPRSAKVTSPSTTKSPTTTTPQPKLIYAHPFTPAQQEVAKGYFAAESAFVEASAQPTMTGTLLSSTHAGPMLAAARRDIRTLAERHEAVRLPSHSQYLIRIDQVSLQGAEAIVQVCAVDDGVLFQRTTGKIVDATTVSRIRRATMRSTRGHWLLVDRSSDSTQPGARACR